MALQRGSWRIESSIEKLNCDARFLPRHLSNPDVARRRARCRARRHVAGRAGSLFRLFRHAHGGALRVWKDEGERSGRLAYEQLQSLPIQWVDQTETLLLEASRIKALHPLSVADAWIAATAILGRATLLHKDPEFKAMTELDQVWLA